MRLLLLFLLLLSSAILANVELYDRGKAYYYGDGVEQDYIKAFSAFLYAAKAGNLEAQTALGLMHIEAKGIEQNDKKGIDLLKKSANKSNAKAQYLPVWHY